jgi:hypothetical protein
MNKQERIDKRNELIVRKFHELYDLKRMRIDDVLEELETKHFFLDAKYIHSIIFYNKRWNDYYESLLGDRKEIIKFR